EDGTGTVVLAAQDTWYQCAVFTANGESNGDVTPDYTNDHITVGKAGMYHVYMGISFAGAGVSNEYDFHVFTNNGANDFPQISAHRNSSSSAQDGNCSACGLLDLSANDTVEVWVKRTDGGAVSKTITIKAIQLTLMQVGGT
ncbi:TNF domain-containing protein, partial [bacterium]|nr:TNF domain-containing protein [bacterium]